MDVDFTEATRAVQAMASGFAARLPYVFVAILVFTAFALAGQLVRASVRAIGSRRQHRYNLGLVLGRLAYGGVILLGLLVALVIAVPGFTPGQLVGLLGLSSVAIGFAFRDILQNFLAGIILLLAEPFRIGDQIIAAGYEGTVDEIQARATFIRMYDGRRVVIPNATLFTSPVTVNTAGEMRRLEIDIGIGYGDDIRKAKQVMLGTVAGLDTVLHEPAPDALVYQLGESTVNIRLRWWVHPPKQYDALASRDQVLHAVAEQLHEAGIDLPFPTHQVLFHDQTEETDGDRAAQREGWPPGPNRPPRPRRIADALRELRRRPRNDPDPQPSPRRER